MNPGCLGMVLIFMASVVSLAAVGGASGTAKVGQGAPDFELKDTQGKVHRLSDDRGAIVVLEWINPECPYVKRHYREGTMKTLREAYAKMNVKWMAIATGETADVAKLTAFAEAQGIDYPILLDEDGSAARAYAAKTTPHMYLIDGEGIVRYMGGIDDDPDGGKAQRKQYVADALKEMTSGQEVSVPQSKPYGCSIKFKQQSSKAAVSR